MRIVINTPAGNIGKVVTEKLLQQNHDVVIISRHPNKVQKFVSAGAQLVQGSIDDPSILDRAMKGANSLFWLTPIAFDQPNYIEWARNIGKMAANAAKKNGVNKVVMISSVGAEHESGVGPIGCLKSIEAAFKEACPNVATLRCGSFMENFFNNLGTIARENVIYTPYPAAKKIPMVATRDIGEKAAKLLLEDWRGFRIVGVHGPENLDQTQASKLIGQGLGRELKLVEVSIDQAKRGMVDSGMPLFFADLLAEMYTGFRAGLMDNSEPRTSESTTPTSLFEFAQRSLKPAIEALEESNRVGS